MSKIQNTKIIAICNQKGGVGKTTTAINLAAALTAVNKQVLIIDLDPQGNASTGLGISQSAREADSYALIFDRCNITDAIHKTNFADLDTIPASIDLSAAEVELANDPAKLLKILTILQKNAVVLNHYDFILIDCPPALGFLTLNALAASDSVLIPLQCEFFALEGVSHLMNTIQMVREKINPDLIIEGVVMTMADKRNQLSKLVEKDVRDCFKDAVYETVVPRNVKISEAPSHGKPVILYDPNCTGAGAYINLAAEFLLKQDKNV